MHFYQPVQGHGLTHDPLNSIIAPRPIGWISSISAAGQVNLAPYSFFNVFNYSPPIIGFASTGWKDSVQNIQQSGEFCWNLVSRPLAADPLLRGGGPGEYFTLSASQKMTLLRPQV